MDQNQEETPLTTFEQARAFVVVAAVTSAFAIGVYHLGRLGYDWVEYGIDRVKEKKNRNKS